MQLNFIADLFALFIKGSEESWRDYLVRRIILFTVVISNILIIFGVLFLEKNLGGEVGAIVAVAGLVAIVFSILVLAIIVNRKQIKKKKSGG